MLRCNFIPLFVLIILVQTSDSPLIDASQLDQAPLHKSYTVGPLNPNNWDDLTIHDPIIIVNATDFGNQAVLEGWEGTGSVSNPFVIKNYAIEAKGSEGVYIDNILNTKYIIRNVYVRNSDNTAFLLSGIGSIIVDNTAEFNSGHGFDIRGTEMSVTNNYVVDSLAYAFNLQNSSESNEISNNVAIRSDGFAIAGANHWMRNNIIIKSVDNGFTVWGNNILLEKNVVTQPNNRGIRIHGNNVTISENLLLFGGISIVSPGNSIQGNIIYEGASFDTTADFLNDNIWDRNLYSDYEGSGTYRIPGDQTSSGSIDQSPHQLDADLDGDGLADLLELSTYVMRVFDDDTDDNGILDGDENLQQIRSIDQSFSISSDIESDGFSANNRLLIVFLFSLLVVSVGIMFYRLKRTRNSPKSISDEKVKQSQAKQDLTKGKLCSSCGTLNTVAGSFCIECGSHLDGTRDLSNRKK